MMRTRIPRRGDIIEVDDPTAPLARLRPARMRLTSDVEAPTGLDPAIADWWLISGWRLGPDGRPVHLCCLTVRSADVRLLTGAPLAEPGP